MKTIETFFTFREIAPTPTPYSLVDAQQTGGTVETGYNYSDAVLKEKEALAMSYPA
ncbi:hypothetical protein [Crocosphaera sp.]|uniref:hypothetical protein n=1 Tax=Crocosphaera sp. TaxID=2729996 RepID=UPI00263882CD|nr:hypothetical protein [Crocosphaera sp.]MDJ0579551.1 hypothetical protein [Crocosphaera sp.]